MANVDLPILSVKLNGVEKLVEFKNNDLFMTSTDIVRIQFDGTNRMKSDNEFIGIAMGFDDGGGSAPYSYPDIYAYNNGVRTKIRDARDSGSSTLVFIYSSSIVDNIVEFSGRACNFTFANFTSYDGYKNSNVITPTITISTKELEDNPIITLKSKSDENGYLKAQLWQDGTLLAEQSKTVVYNSTYTFTFTDINFVSANDLTVKMLNKRVPEELSDYTDSYSILTNESIITGLKGVTPVISDFLIDGTNIDSPIVCTFTLADTTSWIVQAILNDNVVDFKSGTIANTCTFNSGDLRVKGDYTFKLIASNKYASVESIKAITLTRNEPTIIGLEPDNVPQNINKQINLSWTTQNQQSYKLTAGGITYNGTTATSLLLPSNTLTSGTKTMTLTITYTSSWGEVMTATKTVTFLAFGNPPNPILDGTTIYNTALPTFTWTSSEQVAYELKVRNSDSQDIEASGEVISSATQYTSTIALENSSTYTVLLRIKNQYNLWSEWVSKVFNTSFVVPNKPTLTLVATNNSSIIISFNVEYSSEFNRAEIWRKTANTDWIRLAYNLDNTFSYEDKYVGDETYYYKVRAIGVNGGIAESDTLSETLGSISPIKDFHLTNVENFKDNVILIGNPSAKLTNNRKIVSTVFAGSKAPKIDKGETNYKSMSLSFTVEEDTYEKLLEVIDNADVLLYRDGRGRKFYCQVSSYPSVNYDTGGCLGISFSIVEVAFLEGDFYSGTGNQPSLFFDGTWYFNGSKVLSGEV